MQAPGKSPSIRGLAGRPGGSWTGLEAQVFSSYENLSTFRQRREEAGRGWETTVH